MTALQQEIIEAIDDEIDYLTEIERIIRIYVLYQDWMVTYDTDYWIEVMIVIEKTSSKMDTTTLGKKVINGT